MIFICKDKATLLLLSMALAACAHTTPEVSSVGSEAASKTERGVPEEGAKESFHERSADGKASPRFGTTLVDGGNIELGLTLTAPFLNIPLTTGAHQFGGTVGHLVPGAYAPLKYDLGGLVLAGALAVGTIFLLPKFLPGPDAKPDDYFNNGGYPSHGRSDFEKLFPINQTTSAFSNLINRLDETLLSNYHIDTTACAHRIICNAVQKAKDGVANGKPSTADTLIHILTRTQIFKEYFPPSWRDIAESAWTADGIDKKGEGCNDAIMQKRCPVNADIAKIVLGTLIPGS